jgi:L-aminopeptidase/D-esterase-like protein
VIDPSNGLPWEREGLALRRPSAPERSALAAHVLAARPPLNTTIGVVATSATLTKAECTKFAGVAHDGLARAVRPAHSMFDGDTVFGLATGAAPAESASTPREKAALLDQIFEAGAECFARACTRAIVDARSVRGGAPSYRDLCPSAFAAAAR